MASVSAAAAAPTPTPAEVFAAELQRQRAERPRPLPIQYQPLASAIVGDRPVRLATGLASRRALSKVGKQAATTGDTIHASTARPTAEVIAHELTHVAHPSPVPRFFDDDDRSAEERQAERVAAVMRRAPILPRTSAASGRASTGAPAVAPGGTIQRSMTSSSPGTVSAASLVESMTSGDTVQRVQIGGHRAAPIPAPPPTTTSSAPPAIPPSLPAEAVAASGVSTDVLFNRILELLEDRILTELERRGGRFRGGF